MPVTLRLVAAALVAAVALTVPAAASAAAPAHKRITMDVKVTKFVYDKTGVTAFGTASTAVGGRGARRRVEMAVSRSRSCDILSLDLKQLHLELLGLNVDASEINLRITGEKSKVLGKLFCKLSTGLKLSKASLARAAVRQLNRRLRHRSMRTVKVRSTVWATTAQAGSQTCQVLDLVLGPLHLDLLGLVVDLYGATRKQPVEVKATADPSEGILGATLCKLASPQT